MSDQIQIGNDIFEGKLVKSGTRYFHYQEKYVGRRRIDVSKEPSADGWQDWWLFESSKPFPVTVDPTYPYPKLRAATFISYIHRDYGGPGQRYTHAAWIARMTKNRVLVTQHGGLDI